MISIQTDRVQIFKVTHMTPGKGYIKRKEK